MLELFVAYCIAFDFDQTLASTNEGVLATIEYALLQQNLVASENELRSRLSLPLSEIFDIWSGRLEIEKAITDYTGAYLEIASRSVKPLPGATEILDYLRVKNYEIAIISAKKQSNLESLMNELHFSANHIYGNCYKEAKTEKLRELNALVYIGDHPNDVISARNAFCKSIVTITGTSRLIDFVECQPDLFVNSLENIADIMGLVES